VQLINFTLPRGFAKIVSTVLSGVRFSGGCPNSASMPRWASLVAERFERPADHDRWWWRVKKKTLWLVARYVDACNLLWAGCPA